MPIIYVHGVAVRRSGEAGWNEVRPFLAGLEWPVVQAHLRQHVAPVLNAAQPEQVAVSEVFWGDLGGTPLLPAPPAPDGAGTPAQLDPDVLAEALEERGRQSLPLWTWPQMTEVAWQVARSPALRAGWTAEASAPAQWEALLRLAEQELRRRHPLEPWPLLTFLRFDVQRRLLQRVQHLRGPLEGFLPYFMGDIMTFSLRRGTPHDPGEIPLRLLRALEQAQDIKRRTGEPLVILTHSMGGQLLYDTLSAYAPLRPALADLRVDFWAAAASQLGLFASLSLFTTPTRPGGTLPDLPNLAYLWNIWSPSDLLSFQAAPALPDAHDIAMPLTEDPLKAHMAYITDPLFYRIFAAKLRAVLG